MRVFVSLAAAGSLLALAACSPPVPDSAAGVGVDGDPFAARPAQGTTINGDPLIPAPQVVGAPLVMPTDQSSATSVAAAGTAANTGSNADIARETAAALSAAQANSGQAPLEASPDNPAPQIVGGNPRLSDENSFDAVSSRQTIESDAERLKRQRAQYQVVEPTALPTVSAGNRDPNIVQYALSTSNPPGNRIFSRTGINLKARSSRNCAGYASPELAQVAFLEAGGPKRDRYALDPDGDGYACGWDPSPYRLVLREDS